MLNKVVTEYYCQECGIRFTERKDFSSKAQKLGLSESAYKHGPVDLLEQRFTLTESSERNFERCSFNSKDGICTECGSKVMLIDSSILEEKQRSIVDREKASASWEIEQFVKQAKENAEQQCTDLQPDVCIDLKTYLQHLIAIESNILELSQRLVPMMLLRLQTKQAFKRGSIRAKQAHENEISLLEAERLQIPTNYSLMDNNISVQDVGLTPPEKPVYKEFNFFNRWKIERENQQIADEYAKKKRAFDEEYERKKEEEQQRRASINSEIREKIAQEMALIEAKIQKLTNQTIKLDDDTQFIGQQVEKYDAEIAEAKAKIIELCDARARFHKCGVIYPKYLDFIAITTFYEYLITGRCTELTGADGAYNLYEGEIRANRIIAQLDRVVNSLEEIKTNQYYTYTLLNDMRKGVQSLSEQLTVIGRSIGRIEENSAYTAYNTGKIAHYAKVNAELTNALGFLVALLPFKHTVNIDRITNYIAIREINQQYILSITEQMKASIERILSKSKFVVDDLDFAEENPDN